jgi:NitT/TauT family transport system substrate-binding protein
MGIIAPYIGMDRSQLAELWDIYNFKITLGQSLLVTLEDQARWAIENELTDKTEVPNYLNYIYYDAL